MNDKEIVDIKANHAATFCLEAERLVAMTFYNGVWTVHDWRGENVCPPSTHPTKAKAAARVLQLLQLGPTEPQDYPETIKIEFNK